MYGFDQIALNFLLMLRMDMGAHIEVTFNFSNMIQGKKIK